MISLHRPSWRPSLFINPPLSLPFMNARIAYISSILLLFMFFAGSTTVRAQDEHKANLIESRAAVSKTAAAQSASITGAKVACQQGFADIYPCQTADLMARVGVFDLAGGLSDASPVATNDIWGWSDPNSGREFALVGTIGGTSFVEITDAENPVVVGFLATHTPAQVWRDIKVYENHAFIVADAAGAHGMQVFDLTQLTTAQAPTMFEETAHYNGINSAHNIVINEETGFAYLVGGSGGGQTCGGGLHIVNIQDPVDPQFVGCFNSGYTHDAQCVVYNGPDTEHQGKEICIESSVKDVVVTDVTNKSNPVILGTGTYPQVEYVHQGWFTEDHRYFFQNDELDEGRRGNNTKTIVWDMIDLDDPVVLDEYLALTEVIDHNLYIKGDYMYQSNYFAGLRIIDVSNPTNLVEVAYFDTVPGSNATSFGDGSWSNYPFFESGTIAVSSQQGGLFLVQSSAVETSVDEFELPNQLTLTAAFPNPFDERTTFTLTVDQTQQAQVMAYDMLGRQVAVLFEGQVQPDAPQTIAFDAPDLPNGKYIVRATGETATQSQVVTLIR